MLAFGHHRARATVQFFVGPLRRSKAKMAIPPPIKRPALLCVDDDPGMRELYQALLGSHGFEVFVAADARHALELFHSKEKEIAVVLLDYEMPGMNGFELAAVLKRCNPRLPVIMVSGRLAVLEDLPHFVDAAMGKGAPIEELVDQIETLRAIPGLQ